jgi:hypothetical protein
MRFYVPNEEAVQNKEKKEEEEGKKAEGEENINSQDNESV